MVPPSFLPNVLSALSHLAAQVNIEGTAQAKQGAIQRLAEPTFYDIVSPFIALVIVILLPSITALWVIYKTVTDKTPEQDES